MRKYEFDNLKCLMIFLVVFGHLLEIFLGGISTKIYIIIYTFHIPIFVFTSGYFFKFKSKKLIKYSFIYLFFQTIYCLFDIYFIRTIQEIKYYLPYWIMWYLISLILWGLFVKLFDTKYEILRVLYFIIAFLISIFSGFIFSNENGYIFSISRTLAFFPYFLLGYYSHNYKSNFWNFKNIHKKINVKKLILVIFMTIICITYFVININSINYRWLYESHGYGEYIGYKPEIRVISFLFSICMLIILINVIPKRNISIISNIGQNTLIIYLLHGFIIRILSFKINIFVFSQYLNILLALIISIMILLFFGFCIPTWAQILKSNLSHSYKIE